MPDSIDEAQARRIADLFVSTMAASRKHIKPLVADAYPVYKPGQKVPSFLEFTLKFEKPETTGSLLINTDKSKVPIVEYSTKRLPSTVRLAQKASTKNARTVRYGTGYTVAESSDGKLLAELGVRPFPFPTNIPAKKLQRLTGSTRQVTGIPKAPAWKSALSGVPSQALDYEKFRASYLEGLARAETAYSKFMQARNVGLKAQWANIVAAANSHQNTATRSFPQQQPVQVSSTHHEVPLFGKTDRPYYQQLNAHEAPNNVSYSSGCGPTAWANLYGWFDLHMSKNLLPGDHKSNDAYINNLTVSLRDYLGTDQFPGTDQAYTTPDDMFYGVFFSMLYLNHNCFYDCVWGSPIYCDSDPIYKTIRDSIVNYHRPSIVGHDHGIFSEHYGICFAIDEGTSPNPLGPLPIYWVNMTIYPCWGEDNDDYEIGVDDVFAAYSVHSFEEETIEVTVKTGDIPDAGTDAKVYIKVHGRGQWSNAVTLDKHNFNDFERGHRDVFPVKIPPFDSSLAGIDKLIIGHDNHGNKPGWFLDYVLLRNYATGEVLRFHCDQWLAKDEGDGKIERELGTPDLLIGYEITIATSDEKNAGTDANISIRLYGSGGQQSDRVFLDRPDIDDFERGSENTYVVTLEDIGDVPKQITVRSDNSGDKPGWKLNWIRIRDLKRNKIWNAHCAQWFDPEDGLEHTFPLSSG